jgi:hypothetical protein
MDRLKVLCCAQRCSTAGISFVRNMNGRLKVLCCAQRCSTTGISFVRNMIGHTESVVLCSEVLYRRYEVCEGDVWTD